MKTLTALFIAGSCAFAFAAKPDADQADTDVSSPKPKTVHKQSVTAKHERDTPKTERTVAVPKKEEPPEPARKKTRTKRASADEDDDSTPPATDVRAKKVPAHIE